MCLRGGSHRIPQGMGAGLGSPRGPGPCGLGFLIVVKCTKRETCCDVSPVTRSGPATAVWSQRILSAQKETPHLLALAAFPPGPAPGTAGSVWLPLVLRESLPCADPRGLVVMPMVSGGELRVRMCARARVRVCL